MWKNWKIWQIKSEPAYYISDDDDDNDADNDDDDDDNYDDLDDNDTNDDDNDDDDDDDDDDDNNDDNDDYMLLLFVIFKDQAWTTFGLSRAPEFLIPVFKMLHHIFGAYAMLLCIILYLFKLRVILPSKSWVSLTQILDVSV